MPRIKQPHDSLPQQIIQYYNQKGIKFENGVLNINKKITFIIEVPNGKDEWEFDLLEFKWVLTYKAMPPKPKLVIPEPTLVEKLERLKGAGYYYLLFRHNDLFTGEWVPYQYEVKLAINVEDAIADTSVLRGQPLSKDYY